MQEILLKALESICGRLVYKVIYKDINGNDVARPVFTIPECYLKTKKDYIDIICSKDKNHFELEKCLNFFGRMNTQEISINELREYCVMRGFV